jgi:hypothetical protein
VVVRAGLKCLFTPPAKEREPDVCKDKDSEPARNPNAGDLSAKDDAAPTNAASTNVTLSPEKNLTVGSPELGAPQMEEIPELIQMMLEAVRAEPRGSRAPKKVFVERFKGRKTSTGHEIGGVLAECMATCCRATILMKGGNWKA